MSIDAKVNSVGNSKSTFISRSNSTASTSTNNSVCSLPGQNVDRGSRIRTQESLAENYRKALGDVASDVKDGTISEVRDNLVEKGLEKGGEFVERKLAREAAEEVAEKGLGRALGKVAGAVAKKAGPIATIIGAGIDFKEKLDEGKSVKRAAIETGGGVVGGIAAGALGGAAAGALIGGPVGAAIGAIGGAVIGGIAGEAAASKIADWLGIK
ncbi:MAG: hypothetical protein N2485_00785 [bacterium]|nr:hypothetical protein [bacterium]